MKFTEYPGEPWSNILPGLRDVERDLVSKLVIYESGNRLSAAQVWRVVTKGSLCSLLTGDIGSATSLLHRSIYELLRCLAVRKHIASALSPRKRNLRRFNILLSCCYSESVSHHIQGLSNPVAIAFRIKSIPNLDIPQTAWRSPSTSQQPQARTSRLPS